MPEFKDPKNPTPEEMQRIAGIVTGDVAVQAMTREIAAGSINAGGGKPVTQAETINLAADCMDLKKAVNVVDKGLDFLALTTQGLQQMGVITPEEATRRTQMQQEIRTDNAAPHVKQAQGICSAFKPPGV